MKYRLKNGKIVEGEEVPFPFRERTNIKHSNGDVTSYKKEYIEKEISKEEMQSRLKRFLDGVDPRDILLEDEETDLQNAVIDLFDISMADAVVTDIEEPERQTWEEPGTQGGIWGTVTFTLSKEEIEKKGYTVDQIKAEIEAAKPEYLSGALYDVRVIGDDPQFDEENAEIEINEDSGNIVITVGYEAGYDEDALKPAEGEHI